MVTVIIQFTVFDNAGYESATTGTIAIPLGTLVISGTVFNDVNGLLPPNPSVNGIGLGQPSGIPLYANLISSSNIVVDYVSINSVYGTYSLTGQPGTYYVQVTKNQGTIGSSPPLQELPRVHQSNPKNTLALSSFTSTVYKSMIIITIRN